VLIELLTSRQLGVDVRDQCTAPDFIMAGGRDAWFGFDGLGGHVDLLSRGATQSS
jgi:hypothetical protein